MASKQFIRSAATWAAGAIGLAAASYTGYVAVAWFRYGNAARATGDDADALLDSFMPHYEIAGRHEVRVSAPAEVVLSAATEMDLQSSTLARAIFKGREWLLRSESQQTIRPHGFVSMTKSLGWGVLAERPGREIVMGCATKPWESNPVFRTLSPDEFVAFQEPGYVKIAWTLRADPIKPNVSVFRTETRALATDRDARIKFRRYWALLSPGIILIRIALLPAVKREAEQRWAAMAA